MTFAAPGQSRWSSRRWRVMVALVFLLQLGLIFVLSDRRPPQKREPAPAPVLNLLHGDPELLALTDPTLLALPRRRGFSGPAWLSSFSPDLQPAEASEPPLWLPIPGERLATDFSKFTLTNVSTQVAQVLMPAPELTFIPAPPLGLMPTQSRLRLAGDLAGSRPPAGLSLPSWPYQDILPNTVIQVVINPQGKPLSATLLVPCGYRDADRHALEQARLARFEPLTEVPEDPFPFGPLRWGQLIFEWHVMPPPATNPPPPTTQS